MSKGGAISSRRWSTWGLWLVAVVAAVVVGRWWRERQERSIVSLPTANVASTANPNLRRGEVVYLAHCAKCHGPEGHGDGDAAAKLLPPPRDFARRPWRFQPTADSIRRVTRDGIPGTAMPAGNAALSAADLEAVVAYVLTLANESNATPVAENDSAFARQARAAGLHPFATPTVAPDFRVVDAEGKETKLADLRGRPAVLYFWGTSCAHCLTSLPAAARAAADFVDRGLVLVPICIEGEDARAVQSLLGDDPAAVRTMFDESGALALRYEVQALPTIVLLDRQGRRVAAGIGVKDWHSAEMRACWELLTAESP